MKTLLQETLDVLRNNGKKVSDIVWIGCHTHYFTWDFFKDVAIITPLDDTIAEDLVIVGRNWYMQIALDADYNDFWYFEEWPLKPDKKMKPCTFSFNRAVEIGIKKQHEDCYFLADMNGIINYNE